MLIKSKGEKAFDIFNIFLMILLTVMFVYPAILIVCASFTSANMLTKYGYSVIIREFSLSSYKYIFTAQDLFLRAMGNSLFMTALGTFFLVITTSLYAYAVSRKKLVFKVFLMVLVIPMLFAGGTIPYYLVINGLGLMNSQWAIILPFSVNAWYIVLAKNFFGNLPEALVESAQLEGANNVIILFKIVLPLGFPIMATIILYSAVAIWNDWFQAMLFIDSSHKHLWPVQSLVKPGNGFSSLVSSIGGGSTIGLNSEGIKSWRSSFSTYLSSSFIRSAAVLYQRVLLGSVKE
ncbi:MAG: carbohydrate ABC transporter permease [Candidatus Borkfalkia sp.]